MAILKGKFGGAIGGLERLFHVKSPPLIGVDISTSAVKMVELTDRGSKMYQVERYAIEPLPRDSVVEGNINNLDAVSETLKRCHGRLGSSIKSVALALHSSAIATDLSLFVATALVVSRSW